MKNLKASKIFSWLLILFLIRPTLSESHSLDEKNLDEYIVISEAVRPIRSFSFQILDCNEKSYFINASYESTSKNYLYIEEMYGKFEVFYSDTAEYPDPTQKIDNTVKLLSETKEERIKIQCTYPGVIRLHFVDPDLKNIKVNHRAIVRAEKGVTAEISLDKDKESIADMPLNVYITKAFPSHQFNMTDIRIGQYTQKLTFKNNSASYKIVDRKPGDETLFIKSDSDDVILIVTITNNIDYKMILDKTITTTYENIIIPFNRIINNYYEIGVMFSELKEDFYWFYSREPTPYYTDGIPLANCSGEDHYVNHSSQGGQRFYLSLTNPYDKYNSTDYDYYLAISFIGDEHENYTATLILHNDSVFPSIKKDETKILSSKRHNGTNSFLEFEKDSDLSKYFYVFGKRCGSEEKTKGFTISSHLKEDYGNCTFTDVYNIQKFKNLYAMEIQVTGEFADQPGDEDYYGIVISYAYKSENELIDETELMKINKMTKAFQYDSQNFKFTWDAFEGADSYEIYILKYSEDVEKYINNDCFLLSMKNQSESNESVIFIQETKNTSYLFKKQGKFLVNVVAIMKNPLPYRFTFTGQTVELQVDLVELKEGEIFTSKITEYNQHLFYTKLRTYEVGEENAMIFGIENDTSTNKESFMHFYCRIISAKPDATTEELRQYIPTTEEENECASEADSFYKDYHFMYFKVSIQPKEGEILYLMTNIEYELEETPVGKRDKIFINNEIQFDDFDNLTQSQKYELLAYTPQFIKFKLTKENYLSYVLYCSHKHYMTLYLGNLTKIDENKTILNDELIPRQLAAFTKYYSEYEIVTMRLFGEVNSVTVKMEKTEGLIIYDQNDHAYGKAYPYYSIDCSVPNFIIGSYEETTKGVLYIEKMYGKYNFYYKDEFAGKGILPTEQYKLEEDFKEINSDSDIVKVECIRRGMAKLHFIASEVTSVSKNSKVLLEIPTKLTKITLPPADEINSDLILNLALTYKNKKEKISVYYNDTEHPIVFEGGKAEITIDYLYRQNDTYIEVVAELKQEILSIIATESTLSYKKVEESESGKSYEYLYFPLRKDDKYLSASMKFTNLTNNIVITYTRERSGQKIPIPENTEDSLLITMTFYGIPLEALNPYDKYNSSDDYDFYYSVHVIPGEYGINNYNFTVTYEDKPVIEKLDNNTVGFISPLSLYLFKEQLMFTEDPNVKNEIVVVTKKCGKEAKGFYLENYGTILENIPFTDKYNVNPLESFGREDIQIHLNYNESMNAKYYGLLVSFLNNDEDVKKFNGSQILQFNQKKLEVKFDSDKNQISWTAITDVEIKTYEIYIMTYNSEREEYITNDCFLIDLKNKTTQSNEDDNENEGDFVKIIETKDTFYKFENEGKYLVNVLAYIGTPINFIVSYDGLLLLHDKDINILEEGKTKEMTIKEAKAQYFFASELDIYSTQNEEDVVTVKYDDYMLEKKAVKAFYCKVISANKGDFEKIRKEMPQKEEDNICVTELEQVEKFKNIQEKIFKIDMVAPQGEVLYLLINFIYEDTTENFNNEEHKFSLTRNAIIKREPIAEVYEHTVSVEPFVPKYVKFHIENDYKKSFLVYSPDEVANTVYFGNLIVEEEGKKVVNTNKYNKNLVAFRYNKGPYVNDLTIKVLSDKKGDFKFYYESTEHKLDHFYEEKKGTKTYTYNITNCEDHYYISLNYDNIQTSHLLIRHVYGEYFIGYLGDLTKGKILPTTKDVVSDFLTRLKDAKAETFFVKCTTPGLMKIQIIDDEDEKQPLKLNSRGTYVFDRNETIRVEIPYTDKENELLIYTEKHECEINGTIDEDDKPIKEFTIGATMDFFYNTTYTCKSGKKYYININCVCEAFFYATVSEANLMYHVNESEKGLTKKSIYYALPSVNDYFSVEFKISNLGNNAHLQYDGMYQIGDAEHLILPHPQNSDNSFFIDHTAYTGKSVILYFTSPYSTYRKSEYDVYYVYLSLEGDSISPYDIEITYKMKPIYPILEVRTIGLISAKDKNETNKYSLVEDSDMAMNITFIVKKIGNKPKGINLLSYDELITSFDCHNTYSVAYFKNAYIDMQIQGFYQEDQNLIMKNDDKDYYGFYLTYYYGDNETLFDAKTVESYNTKSMSIHYNSDKKQFYWDRIENDNEVSYQLFILGYKEEHKDVMKNDLYLKDLKNVSINGEGDYQCVVETTNTYFSFTKTGFYDVNVIATLSNPLPFTVTYEPQLNIEVKSSDKKKTKIIIGSLIAVIAVLIIAFLLYITLNKKCSKDRSSALISNIENQERISFGSSDGKLNLN